ncbi:MAG: carboxymuconolactone decarboxylase family protein [Mycolicibacterium sp.]|uniref:carboxymuconolactone decarboxylase family protein n=1 Tax=Mycolicibacterium sp. TaxID=2320850 RepID=UPI003D0FF92D
MSSLLPPVGDLTPAQREVYDTLPIGLTRGLLMTRSSAIPYLSLGRSFHDGRLSAQLRELIILRVATRTRSEYELFYHVPQARTCGLPDEVIDRVLAGSDTIGTADLDAVVALVDQLVGNSHDIPQYVEIVARHYSNNEIAEMTLLVGHYLMTSLFVKALGIQPEETAGESTEQFDQNLPQQQRPDER